MMVITLCFNLDNMLLFAVSQFSSTAIWHDMRESFKTLINEAYCIRHSLRSRHVLAFCSHIFSFISDRLAYPVSFCGSDAVDVLYKYLKENQKRFGKTVTRAKAIKVCAN